MTPEELRLECLKLALQSANASGIRVDAGQLLSRASAYVDFVLGQRGQSGGAHGVNGTPAGVGEVTSQQDLQSSPRLSSSPG